jgi:regulation of enolase protein 1 (concanavalin A-like superfamily)
LSLLTFSQKDTKFGSVEVTENSVTISAKADTDWFFEPNGKTTRTNVPRLTRTIDAPVFSFRARVQVDFGSTYDGGTLFVKTAGGAWGKIAYEFSPQRLPTIVSVITKDTSDDADGPAHPADSVYLRIYGEGNVFAMHFSKDAKFWQFLRLFALPGQAGPLTIGLSSQSPTGPGCVARFSEVELSYDRIANLRDGS